MAKIVLAAFTIIAAFSIARCGPDTKIIREFCEIILLQTRADCNQCYEKPRSYNSNGDRAALIFLCCLNYFRDVTHDYIRYLSVEFLQLIAYLTTDKYVLNMGRFVMMCKSNSLSLTKADYNYWTNNGKNVHVCKTP